MRGLSSLSTSHEAQYSSSTQSFRFDKSKMSVFSNRPPDCLHKSVNLWSREEVSHWLCFFGLSRFAPSFAHACIDGPKLLGLFMNPIAMDRLGVIDDIDKQQLTLAIQPMMMASTSTELTRNTTEPSLLLRIVDSVSNETGREMIVTTSGVKGGRSSEANDLVLLDTSISRSHFVIDYKDSTFLLDDAGSTLGTFVMVREEAELAANQVYQFGATEIRIASVSLQGVVIEMVSGTCRSGEAFVIAENAVLGRDPAADVSFSGDAQVSHKHAEILRRNDCYYLRDTQSTNSTWRRILSPFSVTTGDVFKVGGTVILVVDHRKQVNIIDEEPVAIEDVENVKEEDLCKLCFDRRIDTVMIPCGHMVVCRHCGKKVKDCPICRKPFDGIIRTFKA